MLAAATPAVRSEIEALRRFTPFDRMDEKAFEYLATHGTIADYAAGDTIMRPGQGAPRLVIIGAGEVHAEQARLDDVPEEPYPVLGPGDAFPIAALFSKSPVTCAYRTARATHCIELPAGRFPELLARAPALERACIARVMSMLRQARARLHGQFTQVSSEQPSMASPLRAIVHATPMMCSPETSVGEALETMRKERIGSIVVIAADATPVGIFTLQDVLDRVVLDRIDLATPIAAVMTPRPVTLSADATAYEAALAMAAHGIRHAPVIHEGRAIGVVSQRDLFSVQRITLRELPETIAAAQDDAGLQQAAGDIRQLARDMLVNGVAPEKLTQFVAALNDRLTQRILELELPRHSLADIRFSWIALGSEGRLEQTLATDQDNGLIFSAPAEIDADAARQRLLPFATAVNHTLDRCGYPLCKGNIMASNPRWCLSLAEWQAQFSAWIRNTSAQAVLHSAIFFDFRHVFGDVRLAERLRAWLLPLTRATPRFLLQMAQDALATRPPLGILRDFTFDRHPEAPHTIDLKLYGLRPFVEAARIYALRFGIADTNTAQRLRLVAPELGVGEGDIRAIVDSFYFIQLLRLRHQQFDPDAARAPNRIDPDQLNPLDRRILKEAFRQARELQQRMALDYTPSA